jgi:thioredoxin 1
MATVQLTTQRFKDEIFDYIQSQEWKFKGDKPAIIDFYAD